MASLAVYFSFVSLLAFWNAQEKSALNKDNYDIEKMIPQFLGLKPEFFSSFQYDTVNTIYLKQPLRVSHLQSILTQEHLIWISKLTSICVQKTGN